MPVDPMREEPIVPEAPMPEPSTPEPPEAPPAEKPKPKAESPTKLAELANKLYDAATKMQRDAEALMSAINDEPETPGESMSPEESDAASNALIGV